MFTFDRFFGYLLVTKKSVKLNIIRSLTQLSAEFWYDFFLVKYSICVIDEDGFQPVLINYVHWRGIFILKNKNNTLFIIRLIDGSPYTNFFMSSV